MYAYRSSKMDDVKENPWSEICWYMPESREQYRLSGKLYIIKSDEKDAELKKVKKCTDTVMLPPHENSCMLIVRTTLYWKSFWCAVKQDIPCRFGLHDHLCIPDVAVCTSMAQDVCLQIVV